MDILNELTVLDSVLVTGIVWLSGFLVWVLKKYMASYDQNTVALVKMNKTIIAVDQKLVAASEIDRDILVELARLKKE